MSLLETERRREELYFALRSRVLTDAEMDEVERWDWRLTVAMNVDPSGLGGYSGSFNEGDKRAEFNAALLQQFKMRLAAK